MTARNHVYVTPSTCSCSCYGLRGSCPICDSGLGYCSVCHLYEGSLTTDCCGEPVAPERGDRIYAGLIDFRDGAWRDGEVSSHIKHLCVSNPVVASLEVARKRRETDRQARYAQIDEDMAGDMTHTMVVYRKICQADVATGVPGPPRFEVIRDTLDGLRARLPVLIQSGQVLALEISDQHGNVVLRQDELLAWAKNTDFTSPRDLIELMDALVEERLRPTTRR